MQLHQRGAVSTSDSQNTATYYQGLLLLLASSVSSMNRITSIGTYHNYYYLVLFLVGTYIYSGSKYYCCVELSCDYELTT